ncbi:Forkhead-associated protein, partial [Microbacterium sp. NEAU-LLC]
MNATDPTAALVGSLISLLLSAAVYVWIALALSAVFRKSGVESWKAWVPILNAVVVLQLAGMSGWWLLLAFFPVLGAIALVVVFVFAVYRVSVAFGYGTGMTVLGVLAFPVWASVIGWGSARWVGREVDAASRRAAEAAAGLPPLPPFPTPVARSGAPAAFPAPVATDPSVSGFAPPPAYTPPAAAPAAAPAEPAAPAVPSTTPAAAPVTPAAAPVAPAPAPAS